MKRLSVQTGSCDIFHEKFSAFSYGLQDVRPLLVIMDTISSVEKIMASVFRECQGIIFVD